MYSMLLSDIVTLSWHDRLVVQHCDFQSGCLLLANCLRLVWFGKSSGILHTGLAGPAVQLGMQCILLETERKPLSGAFRQVM